MLKKITLLSILSLIILTQPIKASGDVTNAVSTTVALAGGCAAGYFSSHIFYENPNQTRTFRIAKKFARDLAHQVKTIAYGRCDAPSGDELEKYIIGFRTATGVLTFLLIKLAYH